MNIYGAMKSRDSFFTINGRPTPNNGDKLVAAVVFSMRTTNARDNTESLTVKVLLDMSVCAVYYDRPNLSIQDNYIYGSPHGASSKITHDVISSGATATFFKLLHEKSTNIERRMVCMPKDTYVMRLHASTHHLLKPDMPDYEHAIAQLRGCGFKWYKHMSMKQRLNFRRATIVTKN